MVDAVCMIDDSHNVVPHCLHAMVAAWHLKVEHHIVVTKDHALAAPAAGPCPRNKI
jgi:hypothetical protein